TLNVDSHTAALGISYSVLYFSGIITGVAIAILAVRNIVHAFKNKDKISEIVTMQTADDDDIATSAAENIENLSDEEYAKRLREQGEE
ncbi:MAG: TRAP transporter small permease, partial [Clostridium sp.]